MDDFLYKVLHFLTRFPPGPLVAAVAIAGIYVLSAAPDAAHRVPDVAGLQVNPAIAKTADAGFFPKVIFTRSGGVAGTVIDQSPKAGIVANKRSKIVLRVTKGVAQIKVPDVRGIPVDEARARIDRTNLVVGAVSYVKDPTMASNKVITTSPKPNTLVDVGTKVDITVAD